MSDGLDGVDDFGVNPFEETLPDTPLEEVPPEPIRNIEPEIAPKPIEEERPLAPGLLNYYSRYFQLTTADFRKRVLGSLSLRNEASPPDLYGPLWITATVVMSRFLGSGLFTLCIDGVFGGISTEVKDSSRQSWKLVHSAWLFYAYTLLTPFIAQKLLATNFIPLVSTYGYSNVTWIAGCLLLSVVDEFRRLGKNFVITIIEWVIVSLIALKRSYSLYNELEAGRKSLPLLVVDVAFCVAAKILLF
ncbi:hypothetical protein ZYGR_0S01110 [Zygosaccharomyces rouxii]|uniref:ZYRO0F04950p n=2 Tax=Zygosaccharomyces rouxii TaxID=4956 RepID=C5DXG9_ZYGRC|nr:uncharacterized protein ZYRO0F04950g [Zygosaccharomyces rouxii]KAH9199241.1 hypothetical protein LQ764DRAFT_128061 [Zygosaccharomyces rouxii]GAV49978.1 hypothetical protein ZYGR_0S01110 [Zygosaccharomyces rouxii]CAR28480.1 ZYRO0F04950p [Zygosaccharomyces rouxii]